MWGPVGSAEAGVSAGSTATFQKGSSHGITVGSKLGTGRAADAIKIIDVPAGERLSTCSPTTWGTSFTTSLGSGWSSLAARSAPCTSTNNINGYWYGGTFTVTAYTNGGTNICRGGRSSQGSSYWYRTSKGWVWSGGTSDPIWNTNC